MISGRVQGVFYRYTAQKVATRLGLAGWIKNLPDGRVEAVAVGDVAAVDDFIAWCREGPPGARVEGVVSHVLDDFPEYQGFSITY